MNADILDTIEPESDQLNNEDLIGKTLDIKITKVTGQSNEQQPINIHFEGDNNKPYRPCKTMRKILASVWGTSKNGEYIGRSIRLYRDPEVTFGRDKTGGIRISHLSNISSPQNITLQVSRGRFKTFTIQPLTAQQSVPKEPAPDAQIDVLTQMLKDAKDTDELKAAYEKLRLAWKDLDQKQRDTMTDIYNTNKARIEALADMGDGEPMPVADDTFPGDMP